MASRKSEKIIAIIPARGGSKSIPKKNIKLLGGKPLIAWPIELAKSVKRIDRVIVSSDDKKILSVAKKYGAETPFKRPAYLARDITPTLPVLQHTIDYLEKKEGYKADIILLLYATTPFMGKGRIEEALDYFENTRCNSVMGVMDIRERVWKYDKKIKKYLPFYPPKRVNRQYAPKRLIRETGNIFFSRYEVLMKMNRVIDPNRVKFVYVNEEETLDIDAPKDFIKAKKYLASNK